MKKTRIAARIMVGLVLVSALLVLLNPRVQAAFESKDRFQPHPDCPRLKLDATVVAPPDACARLVSAIETVAHALGLPVDLPPIYLVGDLQHFGELIGIPGANATGAVFLGQIFLSPRAFTEADWSEILTHELVHHAWRDHLGPWTTQRRHPIWFQEGLAVFLSGGGAERVDSREARAAIAAGKSLTPTGSGSLLRPHGPADDGLSYPMFYRQAALFVAFLAADTHAFQRLLFELRSGHSLAAAAERSHSATVGELWDRFVAETTGTAQSDLHRIN